MDFYSTGLRKCEWEVAWKKEINMNSLIIPYIDLAIFKNSLYLRSFFYRSSTVIYILFA